MPIVKTSPHLLAQRRLSNHAQRRIQTTFRLRRDRQDNGVIRRPDSHLHIPQGDIVIDISTLAADIDGIAIEKQTRAGAVQGRPVGVVIQRDIGRIQCQLNGSLLAFAQGAVQQKGSLRHLALQNGAIKPVAKPVSHHGRQIVIALLHRAIAQAHKQ